MAIPPNPSNSAAAASLTPPTIVAPDAAIVAKPDFWYRIKRYIMVLMLLTFAGLFAKDGFWTWPEEHAEYVKAREENRLKNTMKDHTEMDIRVQRVLAFVLPPVALATLAWALYNSRGAYRLVGNTLSVPGHPQIQLGQVVEIDRSRWDKKGIAYLFYEAGAAGRKKLRLDDYIYERDPTDEIFKRVEESVNRK